MNLRKRALAVLFFTPLLLIVIAGCSSNDDSGTSSEASENDEQVAELFPGADSPGYSGDCGGRDIVGRYTLDYDFISVSTPGEVFTGSQSEWHLHTQKGCFLWGLGLWSKPEVGKEGCVNWVLHWEDNGSGPLVGMYKDLAGDRFLGYGKINPWTSTGVVWDQFGDPKMEAVIMNKNDSETLYTSCEDALAKT